MTKTVDLAGLTERNCAIGCNANGCVISGRSYCAHPRKGGLQTVDMQNAEALARSDQAREHLEFDPLSRRAAKMRA